MSYKRFLLLALSALLALMPFAARAQEVLLEAERSRAELFGLVEALPRDLSAPLTPRAGLTLVAEALSMALGAPDASFDRLAQGASDEETMPVREYCMALCRAGMRMGVPVSPDLKADEAFAGTIGRSSYFATKDAPYPAPNGVTYENELLFAVAFACGTSSAVTGLPLMDDEALRSQGLDAPVTWAQALAGALRLYEAVPLEAQDTATPVPSQTPENVLSPTPAAQDPQAQEVPSAAKYSWIEVRKPLVNIREGASLEENILAQGSMGERYRTFGLTQEGWYIIEYEEGKIGYISGSYCAPVEHTQAEEGESIGTVTVLTTSSYVRATPSNAGRRIYTARRGQSFECLGQEGNGWYQIRLNDGHIGYIYHKNCALTWFD